MHLLSFAAWLATVAGIVCGAYLVAQQPDDNISATVLALAMIVALPLLYLVSARLIHASRIAANRRATRRTA
jgi:hypothetical protein